jgi:hypothetical protein
MANNVQILRSTTPNTAPPDGTRLVGELWLNFPDAQLGYIDANTDPVELLPVRFWTNNTSYSADDIVYYDGALYRCLTTTTAGIGFVPSQWEDISAAAGDITINQTAHGFDADDIGAPIYFNGTVWALAQAGTAQHSNVISDVLSVDTIKIAAIGIVNVALPVSGGAVLTPGTLYYLSGTAGQITATAPTNEANQHAVGRAPTTSTMMLLANDPLAARKTYVDAADTALDGRLDTAETDITALDGRLDTAETNITSLDGRLDTAETDITALDGRLDTAEGTITSLGTNKADITYVDNQNTAQTAALLGLIIALG